MALVAVTPVLTQLDPANQPDSWEVETGPASTTLSRRDLIDVQRGIYNREALLCQLFLVCAEAGLDVSTATFAQIQSAVQAAQSGDTASATESGLNVVASVAAFLGGPATSLIYVDYALNRPAIRCPRRGRASHK